MANDISPLSVRLDPETVQHLKRVARYEAFKRDKAVTVTDLIKEAIARTYPMPNADENETDET
jgi:hypothetical protein